MQWASKFRWRRTLGEVVQKEFMWCELGDLRQPAIAVDVGQLMEPGEPTGDGVPRLISTLAHKNV